MEKPKRKFPPGHVLLYQFREYEYDVVVAWRKKPRALVHFYFDDIHDMPTNVYQKEAYEAYNFKKL